MRAVLALDLEPVLLLSPSQTARWLSRVTLRPVIWPEMRRLRSPST